MEDVQNNYKVGYFAALFFRVHMKRHFIQPEIMYNVYKGYGRLPYSFRISIPVLSITISSIYLQTS